MGNKIVNKSKYWHRHGSHGNSEEINKILGGKKKNKKSKMFGSIKELMNAKTT